MSIKVITRVLDYSEQRGAARLLLVVLADFANDDGVCWPGMTKLSTKINESERYTLLLIRKLLDSGELLRIVGGGRGRPTLYGIAIGLDSAGRRVLDRALERSSRINTVPEYGVSEDRSAPRAKRARSKNPVPEITDLYNTDLSSQRSVIFSNDDEGQNSAPERDEPPIASDSNRHDHDPYDDDDDDDRARAQKTTDDKPPPPHVAYLTDRGMGAAAEFADLDPEALLADFNARRADGQDIGIIVNAWRLRPPAPGAIYARQQRSEAAGPQTNRRRGPLMAAYDADRDRAALADIERQTAERLARENPP